MFSTKEMQIFPTIKISQILEQNMKNDRLNTNNNLTLIIETNQTIFLEET